MLLKPDWATFPKHWSTWLGVVAIILDAAYVFSDQLGSMLKPETVILLNAVLLPAGMKILQLLKQDIPLAPDVKQEMKENITEAPTATPGGALQHRPPQVLSQAQFNALVDERADLRIDERVELKLHKPRAPRTKALAEKFTKGHKP